MDWGNLFAAGAQVSLISDLLRWLTFGLDATVFSLAGLAFNLIYKLYDFNSFIDTSTILSTMQKSIYSLLAIFMFFKLGFSLLGMLIDPDMVENKEKGAGKLVSGVVVCLVLIALMPTVFDYAMMVQTKVMEGQLIEKAMYGNDFASENTKELGESKTYTLGTRLALSTWKIFMQPTVEKGEAVTAYDAVFEKIDSIDGGVWYNGDLFGHLNDTTALGFLARIPGVALVSNAFGGGVRYQLSYIIIVSTIVGIFLLWTVLKLSIDVAYRSIKMFALQMLAPIAIITYIDPKSSKDGVFAKWVKEAVKTYVSLFVRVFVLAFVSVLLMELDFTKLDGGPIIMLMYILAIIAFIKAAPKFIDNILGTDISKDQDTKVASDLLKQGLAYGTVGGANAIGTLAAGKKAGVPAGQLMKKTLGNFFSSGGAAASAAKKNDFRGVVGAGFGEKSAYRQSMKDWKIPTREEERENRRSIVISDAVDNAQNGKIAGYDGTDKRMSRVHQDSNGKSIPKLMNYDAVNNKYDWDESALETYFQSIGYKHVNKDDANAKFFTKKAENKRVAAEVLGKQGMSSRGTEIVAEQAEKEYISNMDKIQLDNITDKYNTTNDLLSNISSEAATAAGFRDVVSYKNSLETKKTDLKRELEQANSDYNKHSKEVKKVEQKMKEYFGSSEGAADGKVFSRFQKGDYIRGRDTDSK